MNLEKRLERIEQLTLLAAKDALTIDEAAAYLGLGKAFLYRQVHLKRIPHYKSETGKVYFAKTEIRNWLFENCLYTPAGGRVTIEPTILNKRISDIGFSTRTYNALHAAEVATLGELIRFRKAELWKFRGLGQLCIQEIENKVEQYGLKLGTYVDETTL